MIPGINDGTTSRRFLFGSMKIIYFDFVRSETSWFQSMQKPAARMIFKLRRFYHITDVQVSLHWLHVPNASSTRSWYWRSGFCMGSHQSQVYHTCWNSLLGDIMSAPLLTNFRQRLKTHLVRQSSTHLALYFYLVSLVDLAGTFYLSLL